jgi:SIR2-like domain
MQFIRGGPDVRDEVIEALEEDRLILFCGAGLSMPVLPSFKGLVEKVYQRLYEDINLKAAELKAFKSGSYDRLLDLLERRVGRAEVRNAVIAELTTPPTAPTDHHRHVLELAKTADGEFRLVTTNFDDLFERAAATAGYNLSLDEAPKLPVPLPHRWSSLVHLHGRIDAGSASTTNNLILTSADFGRAYLTEGWASRFVTDLFAHFSVLFIGYSAEDPIIRYLLDALAAERAAAKLEDRPRKPYALAGYKGRNSDVLQTEWGNKGVEVLPYRIRRGENHDTLHGTLEQWARWKREGLTGRLRQVEQAWRSRPPASPPYDHATQQVLWALRDPVCARRFADSPLAAPWEWQAPLEQTGMLSRPPTSGRMVPLADDGNTGNLSLDEVTFHLGRWLTRHLDKPETLDCVLQQGGVLHPDFASQILHRMRLPENAACGPQHCPPLEPMLRRAWEIVTSTADLPDRRYRVIPLHMILHADAPQDVVHAELLSALRPVLRLKKAGFYRTLRANTNPEPPTIRDYLDGEALLAGDRHLTELRSFIYGRPDNKPLLAALADDLTSHLKRALDLFALVGQAASDFDPSVGIVQSISQHPHLTVPDWTLLIELLRDGLSALYDQDADAAKRLASRWTGYAYPVFQRLAMAAYTMVPGLGSANALALLTRDGNIWLAAVMPENMMLLTSLWSQIDEAQRRALVDLVLQGPDRPRATLDEQKRVEYAIWRVLSRIALAGTPALPSDAMSRLTKLEHDHGWTRSSDNREDFLVKWSQVRWGFETDMSAAQMLEMPIDELVEKLLEPIDLREGRLQEWQRAARDRPTKGLAVVRRLTAARRWNGEVWQATLLGLKDGGLHVPMFRRVARLMIEAPDSFFAAHNGLFNVNWAVAWWMYGTSRTLPATQEDVFWHLWDRVAAVAFNDAARQIEEPRAKPHKTGRGPAPRNNDAVTTAVNDPAGLLALCLLHRLDARKPPLGGGLPSPVREGVTEIADGVGYGHRLGRSILARSLSAFHAIDPNWTKEHLLRWFNWSRETDEASVVWIGYLTSGNRGSPDLFFALRDQLLSCVDHETELGNAFEQCWQLIVLAALEIPNAFGTGQVKRLLRKSEKAREKAAFAILRYMPEDKPDEPLRAADYWRTRVGPWIATEWPQDKDMRSAEVSEHFALTALQAGNMFPDAVEVIAPFLVLLPHPYFLLDRLANSDHPEDHPEHCLRLLSGLIDTSPRPLLVHDLPEVLARIAKASPTCAATQAFKRLKELATRL